eukprot:TRINITY_DN399_c0_g1_i2.p1 TRINITY_DN399_c0_g1~~TRINITY_DN399_c0_g1_i2.p1  ORF type:complete len:189 (+),score=72.31 TRINITY_DN399_c0_g1_i2:61-627(+)
MDCKSRKEVQSSFDVLRKSLFSPPENNPQHLILSALSTSFHLLISHEHYLFHKQTEKFTLEEQINHEECLNEIRTCFLPQLRSGMHMCFLSLSSPPTPEDVSLLTSFLDDAALETIRLHVSFKKRREKHRKARKRRSRKRKRMVKKETHLKESSSLKEKEEDEEDEEDEKDEKEITKEKENGEEGNTS